MIQTEAHLRQALEQIENLCQAVQSLRAEVFPKNPRNFAILAGGSLDKIRKFPRPLAGESLTCRLQTGSTLQLHDARHCLHILVAAPGEIHDH